MTLHTDVPWNILVTLVTPNSKQTQASDFLTRVYKRTKQRRVKFH